MKQIDKLKKLESFTMKTNMDDYDANKPEELGAPEYLANVPMQGESPDGWDLTNYEKENQEPY